MSELRTIQTTPAIEMAITTAFKEVLNLEEAAFLLNIKAATLRNMVQKKQVPHSRLASKSTVWFEKKELLEYIKEHRIITNDEMNLIADKRLKKIA